MKYNKRRLTGFGAVLTLLLLAAPALAQPGTERVPATNTKSGRTVTIPAHAKEVADGVFYLGTSTDPTTDKIVEGFMVVDRHGNAKGGDTAKPNGARTEKCYAFLASGAKWKVTEDYSVDPTNIDGLTETFVRETIASAVEAWDVEVAADVFGAEGVVAVNGVDEIAPDGLNEVLFADIDSPGTVAVTIVWGIFGGRPNSRQLVEWDQVYDDVDYNFGDATILGSSVMDLLNIAAHEVGHSAGLGHTSDSCTQETMYRFVSPGETLKRDLNTGDIAGIKALYK